MAASQLVKLSSGFHVFPPHQGLSSETVPWQHVRPAIAHHELEQLLHLILWHAVRPGASRWRWRACIGVATEAIGSSEVGVQRLDVELGEDTGKQSSGYVEPVRLAQSARGPGRGASSAWRAASATGGICAPYRATSCLPPRTAYPAGRHRAPHCAGPAVLAILM